MTVNMRMSVKMMVKMKRRARNSGRDLVIQKREKWKLFPTRGRVIVKVYSGTESEGAI